MRTRAPSDVRAHTQTRAHPRPLATCAGPAFPVLRRVRTVPLEGVAGVRGIRGVPENRDSSPFPGHRDSASSVGAPPRSSSRKSIGVYRPTPDLLHTRAPELLLPCPGTSLCPCPGVLVSMPCLTPVQRP